LFESFRAFSPRTRIGRTKASRAHRMAGRESTRFLRRDILIDPPNGNFPGPVWSSAFRRERVEHRRGKKRKPSAGENSLAPLAIDARPAEAGTPNTSPRLESRL
jgi:hypothetical protein